MHSYLKITFHKRRLWRLQQQVSRLVLISEGISANHILMPKDVEKLQLCVSLHSDLLDILVKFNDLLYLVTSIVIGYDTLWIYIMENSGKMLLQRLNRNWFWNFLRTNIILLYLFLTNYILMGFLTIQKSEQHTVYLRFYVNLFLVF